MRIKIRKLIPVFFTLLPALCLLILPLSTGRAEATKKAAPPVPRVVVTEISQRKIPIIKEYSGTITSVKNIDIVPRVSGYIMQRFFTEGTIVKKDAPLYLIDPRPFQARLDAALARLNKDQSALKFWEQEKARYRKLAGKGAASAEKAERARTNYKKTLAVIEKDRADVENARLELGFTTIKAPFAGRILQTRFHEGALVHAQRDVLTKLVKMDPVYVVFKISRRDVFELQKLERDKKIFAIKDMIVRIDLPDGTVYSHAGKVNFIDFLINPATDSVTVRGILPNPHSEAAQADHDLIPGQYAPVHLVVGENPAAILIPKPALLQGELGSRVFVVNRDNRVVSRKVKLNGVYEKQWIITKGLKPGERIIVEGVQKVKNGMVVKPVHADSKSTT